MHHALIFITRPLYIVPLGNHPRFRANNARQRNHPHHRRHEHGEVAQDLLTASLSVEKQASNPHTLQTQINTIMAQALAKAKATNGVDASTEQYNVYPVDPDPNAKSKTPRTWRGMQTLQLKSNQSDALLTLAGALQDLGLTMQDLSYSVSPQKEEDARDALMELALAKLHDKATRAAKALGKTHIDFAEVNVDAASAPPIFHPVRMMAMAAMAAAPMPAPTPTPANRRSTSP